MNKITLIQKCRVNFTRKMPLNYSSNQKCIDYYLHFESNFYFTLIALITANFIIIVKTTSFGGGDV
ncbi:hypothetical protein D1614_01745 [Maribellus luteus]|uniref:Uncharacterized protein n=1 Tax=Maribellus luteus TaxID=2305463 RepID=A0A399T2V9_9BACT|nr:hypothetical protein D1614_01745 [Maribellus luteus]